MNRRPVHLLQNFVSTAVIASVFISFAAMANTNQSEVDIWETFLRPKHFAERDITVGKSLVELRIPQRAEDAGVVPVSVNAKIPQTPEKFIEKVYVSSIRIRNHEPVFFT